MEKEKLQNDINQKLHERVSLRAWKTLQAEQDVQLQDIKVFRSCMKGKPVKDVVREYDITAREVLQTVLRVDRIFRQHAHRHYQAALRAEVGPGPVILDREAWNRLVAGRKKG